MDVLSTRFICRVVLRLLLAVAVGMLFGVTSQWLSAQATAPVASPLRLADDLQISAQHYFYKEVGDKGAKRGELIYGYKCFMCHQKNAQDAPHLAEFYKRSTPTDETLAALIRNGSERMPAFKYALSDDDIADVIAYLRSGTCCVEGENPPKNPYYLAEMHRWPVPTTLSGGPRGVVRTNIGGPGEDVEGVKVQLVAPSGVRVTVYVQADGTYQFPRIESGDYTLRIATPLEFKPYRRDRVHIDGSMRLDDIVLERVDGFQPDTELLPARPEILAQLSGAELLWNLPGSAEDKKRFQLSCYVGCHSYHQIFRTRYDARGWATIVDRMVGGYGTPLTGLPPGTFQTQGRRFTPTAEALKARRPIGEDDPLVQWLTKVRGPESIDPRLQFFPRARGASTRVVVTEYEVPRRLLRLHDVAGDKNGNIWFTSHYTRVFGRLDPRTGIVTEYTVPVEEGVIPATHWISVTDANQVWLSEPWARKITRVDPDTGKIVKRFSQPPTANQYNYAVSPKDGSLWVQAPNEVIQIEPENGQIIRRYATKVQAVAYDNTISPDGKYWAGGGSPFGGNHMQLLDIATGAMTLLTTGGRQSGASRGGWDRFGNAWFGGKGGGFVKLDTHAMRLTEYFPPTGLSPYTDFYEALPDKNGEIWAGLLHGRGFVRFNPRSERWIEYQLPEPYALSSRIWIDNRTTPVTVW